MTHEELKIKFNEFLEENPFDLDAHNCTELVFEDESADWKELIEKLVIDDIRITFEDGTISIDFFNPFSKICSWINSNADWSTLLDFKVEWTGVIEMDFKERLTEYIGCLTA